MDREEGARLCVQSLGIKPGGPNPGGPALGKPRSSFNVNFNSYAHGSRSWTKVSFALFVKESINFLLISEVTREKKTSHIFSGLAH